MIRFIHTADWQIGMKALGVGSASQTVRDARLASIERLVEIANDRSAELMLVTGDIFEDNAVDRVLVRKVGEMLRSFQGMAYIIPGNHDPLTPGSVWEHAVWRELSNVTVIRENTPIELEECILYPFPLKEKYSTRNPTSWIKAEDSTKIAIGLGHGNVEGLPDMEPDFPIPPDAPARTGLDYLAIGHWHSYAPYPDASGAVRLAYSGTHETTKFGERDSGNVLLVEIEKRGAVPNVECIHTGELNWVTQDIVIDREGALTEVLKVINQIEKPDSTLIRLRLSGVLFASDRAMLNSLIEILEARFLFGILMSEKLIPAPDDDT